MKKRNLVKTLLVIGSVASLVSCSQTSSFDETMLITRYSREAGSGTRDCFFSSIGYSEVASDDNWEEGVNVASSSSNSDMMASIANDIYSIGYCSLDGLEGNSSVKALSFNGVEPTTSNVINGDYTLKRNFNYVVRDYSSTTSEDDKNKEQVINAFVEFFSSIEGKNVISTNGGILESTSSSITEQEIFDKYPVLKGSDTVELRTCGSTSVQKVVQALIDKFLGDIPNKNISILMNQNGSGDAVNGITDGINGVISDIGFLSREIRDNEREKLNENNIDAILCIDAVVVIVNPSNTVYEDATSEDLVSIYKGEISRWEELL